MTKTEGKMKEIVTKHSSHYTDGVWFAELAAGRITARKENGDFHLIFAETGFNERGEIFRNIAFPELFMQMFPARFDMILRVCGSMFVRRLNYLNIDRQEVVFDIQYGIGVEDDLPVTCRVINVRSYSYDDTAVDKLEEQVVELTEIMADNMNLLTDTFLRELRKIAEALIEDAIQKN